MPTATLSASRPDQADSVGSLDHAHRTLTDLLTDIGNDGPGPRPTLASLGPAILDSVDRYFAAEERWMAAAGLPALSAHTAQHAAFRAEVVRLLTRERNEAAARRKLGGTLLNWFRLHVELDCARYAEWAANQPSARRRSA